MKKILAVLCGALVLAGCGGEEESKGHDSHSGEPNLDDPETRKQIIAEAIDETKLSTEREGDEKTWPDDGLLFNGWVKDINSRTNKVEMLAFLKDAKPSFRPLSSPACRRRFLPCDRCLAKSATGHRVDRR